MSKQAGVNDFFNDKRAQSAEVYKKTLEIHMPHMACALLLDVSGSMYGEAIGSLNKAIQQFKEQVLSDPEARKRVDIAIITFGSEVQMISDFVPVTEMPTPRLKADGRTEMARGIQLAIDLVNERTELYQRIGTPFYKPWIFMITDGVATSSQQEMSDAAERIRLEEERAENGKCGLAFWALGTGDYDSSQLFSLTKRVVELKDQDFSIIFDWISKSLATISRSSVWQKPQLDDLPLGVRIARQDRAIDEGWY